MTETTPDRIARLELRLQDGFQRIGAAMSQGVDADNWEAKWLELLREYESLEDELDAHHAEVRQQEMSGMPRKEVA